jgi:hypothetical protein
MADQHLSVLPVGDASWPSTAAFSYVLQSGTEYLVSVRAVHRFQRQTRRLPGGCWVLRNQTTGYARFKLAGYWVAAHRFAYRAFVGPIPDGLDIDHICVNAACVRPAHLEPVTRAENQRRRAVIAAMVRSAAKAVQA